MIDQNHRKARLYALVLELHQRGITTTPIVGRILGISHEYARRIRIDMGLHRKAPRTIAEALQHLDEDLRERVANMRQLLEIPTKKLPKR